MIDAQPNALAPFDGGATTMPTTQANVSKPPYTYSKLIEMAITSSPERRMTLKQIQAWISDT